MSVFDKLAFPTRVIDNSNSQDSVTSQVIHSVADSTENISSDTTSSAAVDAETEKAEVSLGVVTYHTLSGY